MEWTQDRVEALTKLWAEGMSAAVIQAQLGVSRNAIIGKVHRLKLPGRPTKVSTPKRRPARSPTFRIRRPVQRKAAPVIDLSHQCSFQALAPRCCKWPLPAGMFCGATTLDLRPYCAGHADVAYRRR